MPRSLIVSALVGVALAQEDCSYFYNLGCTDGQVTTNPPEWASRTFQTPLPGSSNYRESYQGFGRVTCYYNIVYAQDRNSATVEARCRQHDSVAELQYNWNGEGFQSSNTYHAGSSLKKALSLVVKAIDSDGQEYTITLESPNFLW
jgi:hypothetical protein